MTVLPARPTLILTVILAIASTPIAM